ncbi:DUF2358-containing protein [Aureococcus anophagefferens]|nr:DUF2358-containing protein [Aureococcus anophagefferens]
MRLLLLAAAAQALAAPKTGAYQRTSSTTKNIISTLTKVVNLQGGRGEADLAPRARQFDTLSGAAVKEGLAVDFGNEYLWSGKITPELYDEDCVFTDPTLSFAGLRTFEANLANLDFWIESLVPEGRRRVDLFDLALVPGATDRVRANCSGPARRRIKERRSGPAAAAAPPAPGVTFGAGAPTFVVLPGFGNDKVDYSEPLGLGEECGLVAALERRGLAVEVVDVARGDWLQVLTKGIFDGDFFISQTAAADSPAFSCAAHLDDADLQITLACSHSINVPGTSDPTDDWYGAERNVDAWLGPLQQLLRSKKAGLPAWVANLLPA